MIIDSGLEASEFLFAVARRAALLVVHLWPAPPLVHQYLETGDEALREVAHAAACDYRHHFPDRPGDAAFRRSLTNEENAAWVAAVNAAQAVKLATERVVDRNKDSYSYSKVKLEPDWVPVHPVYTARNTASSAVAALAHTDLNTAITGRGGSDDYNRARDVVRKALGTLFCPEPYK